MADAIGREAGQEAISFELKQETRVARQQAEFTGNQESEEGELGSLGAAALFLAQGPGEPWPFPPQHPAGW